MHQTADLAELVCSNSLRGNDLDQAAGLLKEEMRRMDSLVVRVADEVKVPAGSALAVDRGLFARRMTEAVTALPRVTLRREEVLRIPDDPLTIVATGPLTSEPLAASLLEFVGRAHLYFYDAVSPVVEADSIDFTKAFRASRYGKGGDDYLNCPLSEPEYRAFYAALTGAESASVHDFDKERFFEGCLPVEVIGSRGPETLRFGPMKPVGLQDPRTGAPSLRRRPASPGQPGRQPLLAGRLPDPAQVERAEAGVPARARPRERGVRPLRHDPPKHLRERALDPRADLRDSASAGPLLRGPDVRSRGLRRVRGLGAHRGNRGGATGAAATSRWPFPDDTALGALGRYIARSDPENYQPTNIAFGLLPELPARIKDKARKRMAMAHRALDSLERFRQLPGGDDLPAARRAASSA